jgi:hypothetical protein
MYQYDFTMVDLYRMTIENDREQEYFQYWTVENFQKAIVVLDQAGITEGQVQLLIGKVFSRFGEREYREVLLLALALKKGKLTAHQVHKKLQEMEYHARIYGKSICFETETLPKIPTIQAYLGLG